MYKRIFTIIILLLSGFIFLHINAQIIGNNDKVTSISNFLIAQPVADRTVSFSLSDTGEYKPITWGLDLAWLEKTNILRGIAFMGAERVDVIRSSFTPTSPLVDGELQTEELGRLNDRLDIIDLLGTNTKVMLNCEHPSVDPWFVGNPTNWAQLIDVTAMHHQDRGYTIITVAPFNEPDYSATGQGTLNDFLNIAGELRKNPRFDSVRISGGNTLNTDEALNWYNPLKGRLDEGNTHQLAGSFDNYAGFYETVRANGDHATNDELHNVMEAMVGVEYGLQTGIWWGTAEYARGEFVKASDGRRLGYAEHRDNWTAASVYRNQEDKVQAFVGSSERQAATTTYRFVSMDQNVFYDGHGPQREYIIEIPGGTGYQIGQSNAEKVVNITWDDDIQPVINGRYIVVNRNSGKVMEVASGSTSAGANLQQNTNNGASYQQWNVVPVDPRIGGDYSYFSFIAVHSNKAIDVLNWSLDNGDNIIVWDDTKGTNQQWYLEYVEDGWFYIRSRHSAKCLEVINASTGDGANIQQWDKDGGTNQQWRFLPIGVPLEFDPPDAPVNLVATANAESVRLDWSASPETDVAGYSIFRSETTGGPYSTIARYITSTSFVDNTTTTGGQYFYLISATDSSGNRSGFSNEDSAVVTGNNDLVTYLQFDGNTLDSTINLNHCATLGEISFVEGKVGPEAIALNGKDAFVQLPPDLANQQNITIAMWVYWNGGASWQRIFDFGNNQAEYMYLTPRLRFAINNGSSEQRLDAAALPTSTWSHLAITMNDTLTNLYVNGILTDQTDIITISPMDFKPVFNYIGRGQFPVPLFNGYIDDFRLYNYALSANEINQISKDPSTDISHENLNSIYNLSVTPIPANDVLFINYSTENINGASIYKILNMNGKVMMCKRIRYTDNNVINVSNLPSGIYFLQLMNDSESIMKKFIIQHP